MEIKNKPRNYSGILQILVIITTLLVIAIVALISNQSVNNNAPANSNAIFGGRLESGYEFAGYIISDLGATLKICSAIMVSPTQAVTAAHCLDNSGDKFVAIGPYTADRTNYHEVIQTVIHPDWSTFNQIQNDMAIAILQDPIVLSQYAQIVQPSTGCNFVVVGYGKQDNSDVFNPLRKSTDVCIQSTDYLGNGISFTGKEGGLCFGDSGSGVFEAGTNNFVTVASSIDSCYVNNFAAGAQIYGKINLASSTISSTSSNKISCGYIDTQNNGVVDNEDTQSFIQDYLKYCDDSSLLNKAQQCGPKDVNSDGVINLIDFSNFAAKLQHGTCP